MGRPKGSYTYYNLTYNEDIIPEHQKLAVFERDGHYLIGHPDMICECRKCHEHKNQVEFSIEPKPDKYGRKKLKTICRVCNGIASNVTYHLRKKHGPPPANCQICLKPPKYGSIINVDHNHHTNEFRGWLCSDHNSGIGRFNDDPVEMMKGIKYLVFNDKTFDKDKVIDSLKQLITDIENDHME